MPKRKAFIESPIISLFYHNLCRTKKFSQHFFLFNHPRTMKIFSLCTFFHTISSQFIFNIHIILSRLMYMCQRKLALIWRSTSSNKNIPDLLKILFLHIIIIIIIHKINMLYIFYSFNDRKRFSFFILDDTWECDSHSTLRKSNNFFSSFSTIFASSQFLFWLPHDYFLAAIFKTFVFNEGIFFNQINLHFFFVKAFSNRFDAILRIL